MTSTGLLVIGACFAFGLIGRGTFETFSVFLLPLVGAFDSDRATISSIYAIATLITGLCSPLVGQLVDRWGPRRLYALGAGLLIVGFGMASRATELWQCYLTLGVAVGLGFGCIGTVTHMALLTRWFRRRLGTAMGAIWGATGLSSLGFLPLSQAIIDAADWRTAYLVLAASLALLFLPLAFMPWRRFAAGDPSLPKAAPDGEDRDPAAARGAVVAALRRPVFWAIALVFFMTSVAMHMVVLQLAAYLVDIGFPALQAATAIGVAGAAGSVGMILFGWLGDRFGRRRALTVSYFSTTVGIVALVAMALHPSLLLLGVYVVFFGLTLGSRGPLMTGLAGQLFAGPHIGRIFGLMSFGIGLGTALGAYLGGALHDWTQGYGAGFATAFALLMIALVPWWAVPELRKL
jgi:MFS family permease